MNTSTLFYSIKIWATAAFIAPFFQCCIDYFTRPSFDAGYYIYSAISMGMILAIPSLILFWFCTLSMRKIAFNAVLSRLFLTFVGLVSTVVFIYFTQKFQEFRAEDLSLPIPYFVTIVIVIWAYELPVLDRKVYMETVNN